MLNDDKMILLRKFDLWSELSEEEYHALDVVDKYKEIRKGDYIYFEAYNYQMIHFIKSGFVRLGFIDDAGNHITKDILRTGDVFGQITLERNNLQGEFAQAIKSDVSFCSFTIENFKQLLEKKPTLSLRFSKLLGLRFLRFENRLVNILQKDVRTRFILFLEQLLQNNKQLGDHHQVHPWIPNQLTHEEIAHLIGTSRQSVSMLFSQLQNEGIISYDRKKIYFLKK